MYYPLIFNFVSDVATALLFALILYLTYRYIRFQLFLHRVGIDSSYYFNLLDRHRELHAEFYYRAACSVELSSDGDPFFPYDLSRPTRFHSVVDLLRSHEHLAHHYGIPLSNPVFDFDNKYFSPDRPRLPLFYPLYRQ